MTNVSSGPVGCLPWGFIACVASKVLGGNCVSGPLVPDWPLEKQAELWARKWRKGGPGCSLWLLGVQTAYCGEEEGSHLVVCGAVRSPGIVFLEWF